jgi:hypothetical protein
VDVAVAVGHEEVAAPAGVLRGQLVDPSLETGQRVLGLDLLAAVLVLALGAVRALDRVAEVLDPDLQRGFSLVGLVQP